MATSAKKKKKGGGGEAWTPSTSGFPKLLTALLLYLTPFAVSSVQLYTLSSSAASCN